MTSDGCAGDDEVSHMLPMTSDGWADDDEVTSHVADDVRRLGR